jgi:hypothetical protein
MEYALAAIGALMLLVLAGGIAYAVKSRKYGELLAENKALKEAGEGHDREHKAIDDHNSLGDINDDAAVVRDLRD